MRRAAHGVGAGAVLALALAALLSSAQARPAANEWAGTWSTSWGRMVLTQSGSSVSGTYTHDSGRIAARASGLVLTGTWNEAPTRTGPRDAGTLRLTMSPDLRSFSGTWRYADGSGGGGWTGTRTSPPPAVPPPATTTTPADTSAPRVKAYPKAGHVKPATRAELWLSATDDSGRAKVHVALYEGGRRLHGATASMAANGQRVSWKALLAAGLRGPLFFCVWAEDAAGNKSARAPRSSCAWISLLVPITRVSNGCGGSQWGEAAEVTQNIFLDTSTYQDSNVNPLAPSFTVNFRAACNLHDAGYGGMTVADPLRGGVKNFRTWSRRQVDLKFLADMRLLCARQIPATARTARANCMARGGNVSIGAVSRYNGVRTLGAGNFDADLTRPGTQRTGHRRND